MVSLLVGVFLIYNTISASVARRRVEIGILRSLGATRGGRSAASSSAKPAASESLESSRAPAAESFCGESAVRRGGGDHFLPLRAPEHRSKLAESPPIHRRLDLRRHRCPGWRMAPRGGSLQDRPRAGPQPPAATRSAVSRAGAVWGAFGLALLAAAGLASWLALTAGPPAWGSRRRLLYSCRIRLLRARRHGLLWRVRRHPHPGPASSGASPPTTSADPHSTGMPSP